MPFRPNVHDELTINNITYRIAEHPAAPRIPHGQEGKAGTVYCLVETAHAATPAPKAALKVFKPRSRLPFLVSQADRMAPLAAFPGLRACQRTVLTPFRYADLLRQYPDLTYAVLMPWIEGPTWFDVLMDRKPLSPETSLALAHSLTQVLARMEEQGIAHCDLSAPNVMLPHLAGGTGAALVDLEGIYAPDMTRPQELSTGSAGYAHKQAAGGLWGPEADRFAGAVLLAEMLGWCDAQVCQATWGESYFDPQEMQQETPRYRTLVAALERHWGNAVAYLFERAWKSDTLQDCPTFGEWLVALPEAVGREQEAVGGEKSSESRVQSLVGGGQVEASAEIRAFMQAARRMEDKGNLEGALELYRQALELAQADPSLRSLAREIELTIQDVQTRYEMGPGKREIADQAMHETEEVMLQESDTTIHLPSSSISPQNAAQVVQLARLGIGRVICIAWFPNGKRLAIASSMGIVGIYIYNAQSGQEIRFIETDAKMWYATFAPDLRLVALSGGWLDKTIKLWDVASGREVQTLSGHAGDVKSVAFAPDGRTLASGSDDKTIKLWDVASGREVRTLSGHRASVFSVAFAPDGRTLASGSKDMTIKLWDVASGREVWKLSGHGSVVQSVAFSPDGRTLASGSLGVTIKLWDVASGREVQTLRWWYMDDVWSVAFAPDGRTLASGLGQEIKLWNVASGLEVRTLSGHKEDVWSVAFSPDGRTLASGSLDKTIKFWDVSSGREVRTLRGHKGYVRSVAFSPNGRTLASGSDDNTIKLWDVASGREVRTLRGHTSTSSVWSVAFSPDGRTLASGSDDNTIKLWDVASGREVRTLSGHTAPVLSVAFAPDGRMLASGSSDGTVRLWGVK